MPHSGACDCSDPSQAGVTNPCTITTALGTQCAGTEGCNGVSGWSACQLLRRRTIPTASIRTATATASTSGDGGSLANTLACTSVSS